MGSRAPWETRLHFGRLLGLHFAPQMTPREAKETPNGPKWSQRDLKWSQMEPKRCQISVKINVKISINFHIPFSTKNVPKGCQNKSKIYPNSMPKLMSYTSGCEKCDMQSDRENTYDSSLFSNIEVIKNNENHYKNMLKIHSYTKSA